jgi:hypothetical protein
MTPQCGFRRYVSKSGSRDAYEVLNIGSSHVYVDDLRCARMIPDGRVVFDWVIADGDDHVRSGKKLIAW